MNIGRRLFGFGAAALVSSSDVFGAMAQEAMLKMHQFFPPQADVPKLLSSFMMIGLLR